MYFSTAVLLCVALLHVLESSRIFFGTHSFVQVLIAVISDTFDRLQERRESSWVKGQAQLTQEVELVFGRPGWVAFRSGRAMLQQLHSFHGWRSALPCRRVGVWPSHSVHPML